MPTILGSMMRRTAGWLLAMAMAGSASAAEPSNDLKADLFGALALSGHYCQDVVSVDTETTDDYTVNCTNGRRFRVIRGQNDRLTISELDQKAPPRGVDHDSLVRRHLFSIINLTGNRCDRVTEWRHLSRLSYQLRCANSLAFKILVGPKGRIIVAEQ